MCGRAKRFAAAGVLFSLVGAAATGQDMPADPGALAPGEIVRLAVQLSKTGDAGAQDRAALAQHVTERFLADAQATRGLSPAQWNRLHRALRDAAPIDQWAPPVWSAFANDPKALTTLEVFDATMGSEALEAILPKLPPCRLGLLADRARKAGDQAQAQANRQVVLERLAAAVADPQAVVALDAGGLRLVVHELATANPELAASTALTWFRQSPNLPKGRPTFLASAAEVMSAASEADRNEVIGRVEAALAEKDIRWDDCARISEWWSRLKYMGGAQQWAMRAYQSALGAPAGRVAATHRTIIVLAEALEHSGLIGKGRGYPEAAEVLVRLIRDGKLQTDRRPLLIAGILLGTPQTIETVEAELLDPQALPRVPVAKMLTWSHCVAERINRWMDLLDQHAAEAEIGEAKARWMIASVYAKAEFPNFLSDPLDKDWITKLFESTESTPARLEGLTYLTRCHGARQFPGCARVYLEQAKTLLADDGDQQVAATLAALDQEVAEAKRQWLGREIQTMRQRAAYSEAQAAAELEKGDPHHASKQYLRNAANYRSREAELLKELGAAGE